MIKDLVAIGVLQGPGGVELDHCNTLTVGWALDRGWTWSATVQASPDFNIQHSRYAEYTITLKDGFGRTLVCPPMVALPRSKRDPNCVTSPGKISLSGVDATTRKMGIKQQNFRSFRATTSTAIVSALAARVGVTITGLLEWYVQEEEVKGEVVAEALDRLIEIAGYQTIINPSGVVVCSAWEAAGADLDFIWSNRELHYDDSNIFTGKRIGKRSSRNRAADQTYEFENAVPALRELQYPLLGVSASEVGDLGAIQAVAFFNGPQNLESTGLVTFLSWDPTISGPAVATGPPPATHMTVTLRNLGVPYPRNAILRVTGAPYDEATWPPGLDLAFLYPAPNGDPEDPDSPDTSLGDWPSENELIDPLFLGEAWAIARYPYILGKENSGGKTISMDGVFQLGVALDQRDSEDSQEYKVIEVSWSCSTRKTEVTMAALAA